MPQGLAKHLKNRAAIAAKAGMREAALRGAGIAVAGFFGLCAFVFLLIAVFHVLSLENGPVFAALVMSAVLAIIGLFIFFIAQHRADRAKLRRKKSTSLDSEYRAAISLASDLGANIGKNTKLTLPLIGLAIGFFLATRKSDDE